MNLYGKSRQEIAELTKGKSRRELVNLLWRHASLEPMFSPEQIAAARQLAPRTIKALMRRGIIRAHIPSGNRYRALLSEVWAWDAQTALSVPWETSDGGDMPRS